MDGVYGRIVKWMEIDENENWDMGDMYGLEMIGELNEKELVEELKNLREEIEVMERMLKMCEMMLGGGWFVEEDSWGVLRIGMI